MLWLARTSKPMYRRALLCYSALHSRVPTCSCLARTSAPAARTFLEIGSGLGSKAIIMENVHPDIHYLGLELHRALPCGRPPACAQSALRPGGCAGRSIDTRSSTCSTSTSPFETGDQQLALERTICNSARVGAVLIRVLGHADAGRSALPGWTRIGAFEDAADAMSSAWVSLWRKVGSV